MTPDLSNHDRLDSDPIPASGTPTPSGTGTPGGTRPGGPQLKFSETMDTQRSKGASLAWNDTAHTDDNDRLSTATTVVERQTDKEQGLAGLLGGNADENDPFLVEFEYNDAQDPNNFASWRKWQITFVTLFLELWANVISSSYAFGASDIAAELGIGNVAARIPAAVYLFGFALGPVVLAPASEDYGRYPVIGGSFLLVALCQIPCGVGSHLSLLIVFRFLAGFFAAATFNSIGTISDMWNPDEQGWAVNCFAVFAEVGAALGPVFSGYLVLNLGWRWIFGVNGIVAGFLLVPFLLFVPETRQGVLLASRAKRLRESTGDDRYYAMHEKIRSQHTASALFREMVARPIVMLFTEPIVASFAVFDGVNYAVIYIFLEAYPLVFADYGFNQGEQGLAFIGIIVGFLIGFALYAVQEKWYARAGRRRSSGEPSPEDRILWGLPGGVLFPVSLLFFAWTSFPPVPWIVPVIAGAIFGISSHILFLVVSDYTVASYSCFAASAVAAQSLLRELLSGSVTLTTEIMYHNLGYKWASSLLGFVGIPLACIPFVLYYYGPTIRARSSFAEEIALAEQEARLRNDRSRLRAEAKARQLEAAPAGGDDGKQEKTPATVPNDTAATDSAA
ncbi:uncharacterized protein PFL1_00923 [Pseudozyma flocculosa PF-1]|uniref:Related to mfs-multidrug-resistance transporter n=1 Tax=Pseudozyma flocculosa TaxID=84751 RepID=A0A5C3F8C3_9BASI|nr:uncharacterized protein PFL1_00923 [Pseudozyma flocculosa PF-1]EPQ31590.1 hypothetical protein PFL1_00923 [Pseudozyma flocculosa PF-1]SPO40703.1 related to mfs-multidrug-resistance transporter [Pseudozyma flocculosa]